MTSQKFKNATKLILAALLVVSLYSGGIHPSAAQTAGTQQIPDVAAADSKCTDNITHDIKSKYASFDEERAKAAALNYGAFKSEIRTDNYKFNAVSQTWTNDPVNCTVTLKSVLVQYTATDSTGKERVVTVSVDPKSYVPQSVDVEEDLPSHATGTSTNWGGYTIKGASTEASSLVYSATMNWLIPTPSDPPQLDCGTTTWQKCYISVWTGLAKTENPTSDLAQLGTDSICLGNNCSSGRQYKGWIETVPGGYISQCTGNTYVPGDSMYGEVVNQKKNGGLVTKYDFYLIDTTQSQSCSALNQTFGSTDPHYGLYMTERPNFSGTLAHLANFGSISNIYGTIYYGGSNKNIYVPYSTGSSWYTKWTMYNGVNNESISTISSSNVFTVAWLTSQGT